jgi:ABC-type glycerol-3-phosphate transport system substrate-binding protein
MKRMLALLCAILMLTSVVACGKAEPEATTAATTTVAGADATTAATEPAETEPPKAFDSVPAQNLGGEFHIRYAQADNCFEDFHAETMNGDVKNDAIYERNLMVEEKLGIDVQISWDEITVINNDCKLQVQAGSSDYDLFGGHRSSLLLSYQGQQYDLSDISTLDLTQEWWDQGYIDAITVNDSLYTVIGDAGVSTLLFVSSMTFNKKLMDEAQIAYPYDLVREGKWTLDAFHDMIVDYGSDLNGDGQVKREDDLLSLIGWGSESGYSTFYSSGFSFINRDAFCTGNTGSIFSGHGRCILNGICTIGSFFTVF